MPFVKQPIDKQCIEEDLSLTFPNSEQPALDRRDSKTYYYHATPFRRIAIPIFEAIYRFFARLDVEGAGKLPAAGGVILAANHLSNYDVFPLQFSISRPLFFMGKEELYRNRAMDWMLRQMGSFPVYRGEGDDWAMLHAQRVLEHGQVLGMFPEGSRNKGKGLSPGKSGVARLALVCKAPVMPVALHGPQYMFHHFPSRTTVQVRFGELIRPQHGETILNLTDRLMFALAELLPPEARGVYRFRPPGF